MLNAPLSPARSARALRPTLVADVIMPVDGRLSAGRAALSAAAVTLGSGVLLLILGLSQAGIFAVFLTASTLAAPLTDWLDDNREAIWHRRENPWLANTRTVFGLLAIFFGMAFAFTALAAWLGEPDIHRGFGFATARIGPEENLFQREFGPWFVLLKRNLVVLAVLLILTLVFRTHGALLVLGWNAAAWSGVLVLLTIRVVPATDSARFVAAVAAALGPHIVLEASAYVVAALGAIFFSRGVALYPPADRRFMQVLRAAAALLMASVGLLVAAALVEHHWAGTALKRLGGELS